MRVAAGRWPDGAVVVVGNAPTALFEVVRLAAAGEFRPALVIGLPVGFVGAADAKAALRASGLPSVSNVGERGGSAVAAAALNALWRLATATGDGRMDDAVPPSTSSVPGPAIRCSSPGGRPGFLAGPTSSWSTGARSTRSSPSPRPPPSGSSSAGPTAIPPGTPTPSPTSSPTGPGPRPRRPSVQDPTKTGGFLPTRPPGTTTSRSSVQKPTSTGGFLHTRPAAPRVAVVVRLKSGDPFVCSRGGEEMAALVARGIHVEVTPGVSAATAAPLAAGMPRGRTVTILAGNDDPVYPVTDLGALADADGSLVVLVGRARQRHLADALLAAGLDPDTPAAVVHAATRPGARVVHTTLEHLGDHRLPPPATVVIGPARAHP